MTGQSSGRGLWVMPMVYHMTTSWLWRVRLAAAQRGRPSPPRVPQDYVLVVEGAVGGSPARQAIAAAALVGVVATRVDFAGLIGSDPDVRIEERGPLADPAIGLREGDRVFAGEQRVAGGVAERVARTRVDHDPFAAGGEVQVALRFAFGAQFGLLHLEGAAIRVRRTRGHRHAVHFDDAIGQRSIHIQVQPEGEEVLMVRRGQVFADHMAVGIVRPIGDRFGRHHPGERHAHFEAAVLVEDPFEAVIVVAGGGDETEYQVASAPGLVLVLPGYAAIALVKRDGVGNGYGAALGAGHHGVEDGAIFGGIHAGLQGGGVDAQAEFAGIEAVAEEPAARGIAVGNHHFGERSAIQYRAHAPGVLIADSVEDETLAGV